QGRAGPRAGSVRSAYPQSQLGEHSARHRLRRARRLLRPRRSAPGAAGIGVRDARGAGAGDADRPARAADHLSRAFRAHQPGRESLEPASLIATILRRFAAEPERALANMPARVQAAPHLGVALGDEPRDDLPGTEQLRAQLDQWRVEARAARRADGEGAPAPG